MSLKEIQDILEPKDERQKILAEFFGVDIELINYWILILPDETRKFWDFWTRNGQTEEALLNYNTLTMHEPAVLCFNFANSYAEYPEIWEEIKNERPQLILDYGAGSADFAFRFAEKGSAVAIAEFPGLFREFIKWRFREMPERLFIRDPLDYNFIENYHDMVICLDVLEHLKDPIEMIKRITRTLKPKGLLVLKVSCCSGAGHCEEGMIKWLKEGKEYLAANYEAKWFSKNVFYKKEEK